MASLLLIGSETFQIAKCALRHRCYLLCIHRASAGSQGEGKQLRLVVAQLSSRESRSAPRMRPSLLSRTTVGPSGNASIVFPMRISNNSAPDYDRPQRHQARDLPATSSHTTRDAGLRPLLEPTCFRAFPHLGPPRNLLLESACTALAVACDTLGGNPPIQITQALALLAPMTIGRPPLFDLET